jgi:CheY-like chemotaxis protein
MGVGEMVLIVDDDFEVRDSLGDVLGEAGYQVTGAAHGGEALDLLRGGLRPLAIVLDVMMPVVDGVQFRLQQRGEPDLADIPVIVLSADRQVTSKAADLQALAYLTKPTRVEVILGLLDKLSAARPA